MTDINQPGLGDALRVVERIARETASTLTLGAITLVDPPHGVPAHVPVLVRDGSAPALTSVRALLEEWRTAPEQRSGTAEMRTLHAFIDLVNRHKDASSALFAQTEWPDPSLVAIIDYHTLDHKARFGRHRILYPFPLTREFDLWIRQEGKAMSQIDFAEFIDANIRDLSVPLDAERAEFEDKFRAVFAVPTDLVALARGLEINVNSKVKQAVRLQSGEASLRFETEHTNATGEPLRVPGLFMLSCRAFVDGAEMRLPAQLRYKVRGAEIFWSYQLYKWEDALRAHIASDIAVAAAQTALPAYEGEPEAVFESPLKVK